MQDKRLPRTIFPPSLSHILHLSTIEPGCSLRYRNLEPCPQLRHTVFCDRNTGDREDLAGKVETKPGVLTKAPYRYAK